MRAGPSRASASHGLLRRTGLKNRRANSRRRSKSAAIAALLLLLSCATAATAAGDSPGSRPGVFLQGATVPRAKALALDAALIKGWVLAQSARDHVIFETLLEEPAGIGPPNALPPDQTLLRIRADFIQTPAGVNAYLYAEEVWYAGSSKEWISDVTEPYRSNLRKALSSLQQQWTALAKTRPGAGGISPDALSDRAEGQDEELDKGLGAAAEGFTARPHSAPKVRASPLPADNLPDHMATDQGRPNQEPTDQDETGQPSTRARLQPVLSAQPAAMDYAVGIWAYHAEHYARGRGCVLGELGAILVSGNATSELHKVNCIDGSSLMVRCDRERCVGAR
jgi:hypothetical protein